MGTIRTVSGRAALLGGFLVLLVIIASGCSKSVRVYLHPDADISYYEKVGVLPFRSLSGDRFAGEKFGIEFTTALLATEMFDVIDYGIFVNQVIQAIGTRAPADGPSVEQLQKIAEATGVQGIFYGTVMQYEMVPTTSGNFPSISVEARLIDAETGTVVWMVTHTERGGPKTPIIGIGETHTLGELTQSMCKGMMSRLK